MFEIINAVAPYIYGGVALACVYMISQGKDTMDTIRRIGYSIVVLGFTILVKVNV